MTATIICWGCRPGRSSWPAGCPAKVAPDCHIVVDKVLYSVPWTHVGASTDTRVTDTTVAVHVDGKLVKTWPKAQRGRCTDEADYPPEKIAFFSRNPVWCRSRARDLGPHVAELVDTLLAVQALHRLRSAQGVIGLAERHGPDRLDAACARALAAGDLTYRTVRGILAAGTEGQPAPGQESADPAADAAEAAPSVATPAHLHGPAELLAHLRREDTPDPARGASTGDDSSSAWPSLPAPAWARRSVSMSAMPVSRSPRSADSSAGLAAPEAAAGQVVTRPPPGCCRPRCWHRGRDRGCILGAGGRAARPGRAGAPESPPTGPLRRHPRPGPHSPGRGTVALRCRRQGCRGPCGRSGRRQPAPGRRPRRGGPGRAARPARSRLGRSAVGAAPAPQGGCPPARRRADPDRGLGIGTRPGSGRRTRSSPAGSRLHRCSGPAAPWARS